jgi:[acyl-carrier-protein] S-malonyltransferase
MTKLAFLFPGQGVQRVGMGRDLYDHYPAARQIMDRITDWIDPALLSVIFEGPEDLLRQTRYTQPAILAVSLAALAVFQEQTGCHPDMAAGHSLGEYGALYAAGVIDLETAAKLVKKRAELMDSAPPGAMAAIIGLPETQVQKAVLHMTGQGLGPLVIANYNTADQYVISGDKLAVESACAYAREELGAKRALMLPVGGAFHSPLMDNAAQAFAVYLHHFRLHNARFPVITNRDAQLTTQADAIQEKLSDQIRHSVLWLDTMRLMHQEGVKTFIEIGPGKALTGMVQKIYKDAHVYNVFDAASLEHTVTSVRKGVLA